MRHLYKKFITLIFVFSAVPILPSFATPVAEGGLSDTGVRAFNDLTRCINTKKQLDVYYLIDESESLKKTDSRNARAEILASSLKALGNFKDEVHIDYAVGFFGAESNVWKPWTAVKKSNLNSEANELAQQIRLRNRSSGTDWRLGILDAQKQLQAQRSKHDSCQALIWLTDGGIWVGKASEKYTIDQAATNAARDELCSATFQSLRQANVSVFGVLLKNDEAVNQFREPDRSQTLAGMNYMRAMVEGRGSLTDDTNGALVCGTVPIPNNYSAGGLLIAQDPVSLAVKFIELNSIIEGGTPANLGPGNPATFKIEAGVRKFRLLTTSNKWRLTSPDGTQISDSNASNVLTQVAGINQITIEVKPNQLGDWKFEFDNGKFNRLLLFSGLGIKINAPQLLAGTKGQISGQIFAEDGSPVDLNVYSVKDLQMQEVLGTGAANRLAVDVLTPSGNFKLSEYTPSVTQSRIEVRATLNTATKSGIKLAPVSISTWLEVKLPSDYPTLGTVPIKLSTLKGNGSAEGKIEVIGPQNGSGSVCLDQSTNAGIQIVSDSVQRVSTYKWIVDKKLLDDSGCLKLDSLEKKEIPISVSNSKSADSEVQANIPLRFVSDSKAGQDLKLDEPIEFKTEFKRACTSCLKIALFAIGIALPLAFGYLLTFFTTKLIFGPRIQRAEFPISISSSRGILGADGSALSAPTAEEFKLIPSQADTRKYQDRIGLMRAKVSKLVFKDPTYHIEAIPGSRIFTFDKKNIVSNTNKNKLNNKVVSGLIAPIGNNVENFWAISIKESDLSQVRTGSNIPGTLVVYKRNKLDNPNQHIQRMTEVLSTAGIWQALSAASNSEVKAKNAEKRNRFKTRSQSLTPEVSDNSPLKESLAKNPSSSDILPPPPPPPPPPPGLV